MAMDEFHGKGYSSSPIKGDEAAQLRHLLASVSQDWGTVKKLITVINAVSIIYDVIKYCGPVLITLSGIGYYLKIKGIL